jgi:putative ABC transport system permease protein
VVTLDWLWGLIRRRPGRLVGTMVGVGVAVALLASIGVFLAGAQADMTRRAIANVPVDWQVEAQPGADSVQMLASIRSSPGVRKALPVGFAATPGLQASSGGTSQTTGAGVVVGLPGAFTATFPGELRSLAGSTSGVLLAQQTAANLHAVPGDTISVGRAGLPSVEVRVDGVVDLPLADSLFQKVGAPAGAQAQAPPDNVLLLPDTVWHGLFDPLTAVRPDLVRNQVHVRLDRRLPHDPAAAFVRVSGAGRHLEAQLAGTGLVGNNLAAALDAARGDALYAQVLFLFLGFPGVVLAGLLTVAVAAAGRNRRRRYLALLRVRGATSRSTVGLAASEAAVVAAGGGLLGLIGAAVVGRLAFSSVTFGATTATAVLWAGGAVVAGAIIAGAALVVPVWRDTHQLTVAAARHTVGRPGRPRWARAGLDFWLLAAAGLVFWLTSRSGYHLVLAPEGVAAVSVSYWALAGPALLWLGAGLLAWRAADALLGRGRSVTRAIGRPMAGGLAGTISASLSRRRQRLASAVALVAMAGAFAISTAVFNTTYRQQANVDARLTNGADVTVAAPAGAPLASGQVARLASVSGVHRVEPLLHRFAYVGADLQDLYGVQPGSIGPATRLQDAYFQGGSAARLMGRLAAQPDNILVSAETVKDFQLQLGDQLKLRLRDSRTGEQRQVVFHYAGVVKEFPTAPKDSFFVANAAYLAQSSGNPRPDVYLIDTGSSSPRQVAGRIGQLLGSAASVTNIADSRREVGSSLTAVDLVGLTKVELGFALLLGAAATGLLLALELAERRRSFAIAKAIGARPGQTGAFVRVEAAIVTAAGLVLGTAAGAALAVVLVKVLTGVFDPPPAHLGIPGLYLVGVGVGAVLAAGAAAQLTVAASRGPVTDVIREL